jgi:MFS family permease
MAVAQPPVASTAAVPADAPWPSPRYAWFVVALLVLGYAFSVVDRIVIGLLVEPIKADLGLSDTQLGLIQGLAFGLLFTLLTLPIGLLVDRWRRVPVLWAGALLWSGATVMCAFTKSFWGLFAARMVVGGGSATLTPGASSLIADYFEPKQRPRAYGIYMMGGSIGIGTAYLLSAAAIQVAADLQQALPGAFGGFRQWQIVFMLVGAPGLLLALVMALLVREPVRRGVTAPVTEKVSLVPLWRELKVNHIALIVVMMGAIMNIMIVNAQLAWFPALFFRVHDWTPAQVGATLAMVGVPFGLLSAITAGWALTWMAKKGREDGPILLMILQCTAWATFGTYKCLAPEPQLALAGHVGTSLFATWAVTSAMTALNQITPNQLRGQVIAVYTLMVGIIGVGVGALVVGLLSDYVFTSPTGIAPSLAVVNLVGGMIGIFLLIAGRSSYKVAVRRAREWGEG